MKKIQDFLTSRPILAIRPLEKEIGCPNMTLAHFVAGNRPLPERWIWKTVAVLAQYGLNIGGWTFEYDKEIDAFFVEKKIDRPPVIHEVGKTFEYQVWYHRQILSDDIELIDFLNNTQNA